MNANDPAVAVVVPVRNEAGNIAPLVAEIAAALDGQWPFEVVYVNDGSSDGTEAELGRLKAQHSWLRSVRHKDSCGQSAAVRSGVFAARAPLIVTIDGDGQNDPRFIPASVARAGSRRAADRPDRRPARQAPSRAVSRSCNRASPMRSAAPSCATAPAIPAAASRRSAAICSCGCLISTACIVSCRRWSGARAFRSAMWMWWTGRAAHGVSNYGLWDRLWVGILDLAGVWWLIRRRKRVPEVSED